MTKVSPLSLSSIKIALIRFCILSGVLLLSTTSFSQCWSEVWSDEFPGSSLDLTKWDYELGTGCPSLCGWGNNEKEYYTNSTNNVNVAGGYLNITAKYQPNYLSSGADFTSGKIQTRSDNHDWLYGRFEASIKLPAGTGMWPAFWLLPKASAYGGWPTSGEIDIMEYRGDQTTKVDGTLHYGNSWPNNQHDGSPYTLSSGNFTSAFHEFAVEWEPGEIRWYVDDVLFKTEKQTPNSLNPASNNAVNWPWDKNFYLILNMAVGGWYSGDPSTATIINGDVNYTRTMQVDYVRVYTDLSGGAFNGTISGKSSVLQNETAVSYSIPATATATYAWTATGGTIAGGQGTEAITVNWGTTASGTVSVVKTLGCGAITYNLPVAIAPTHCGLILEDFENVRFTTYGFMNGVFNQKVTNPASSTQNTSPYCATYVRNSSEQYDVLILDDVSLGNVDDYEKKIKRFMMDVYSDGAGKIVEIVLEKANSGAYPAGRHSVYRATTSTTNEWETLEFVYVNSPDGALLGTSVDQLTILFRPNTFTNSTFYIDNLLATYKPNTSTITGSASVCENQAGVTYSVTNTTGSTYAWTVPSDASITAGGTTNSITVTYGSASGNVAVTETNTAGCAGDVISKAVAVGCVSAVTNKTTIQSLGIYPNPANTMLTIPANEALQGIVTIRVMDKLGRVVGEYELSNYDDEILFNVSDLLPDMYILELRKSDYIGRASFFKN